MQAEVEESTPTPIKNKLIWAIFKLTLTVKRQVPINAIIRLISNVGFLPRLSMIKANTKYPTKHPTYTTDYDN